MQKERIMDLDKWRFSMSRDNDESNVVLYMLAGVGLGAIIGAAAGLLFAPKAGMETREDLSNKFKELKGKTEEWISEQRAKRAVNDAAEELGV
jgi:gas vesicle protein